MDSFPQPLLKIIARSLTFLFFTLRSYDHFNRQTHTGCIIRMFGPEGKSKLWIWFNIRSSLFSQLNPGSEWKPGVGVRVGAWRHLCFSVPLLPEFDPCKAGMLEEKKGKNRKSLTWTIAIISWCLTPWSWQKFQEDFLSPGAFMGSSEVPTEPFIV